MNVKDAGGKGTSGIYPTTSPTLQVFAANHTPHLRASGGIGDAHASNVA
ncbi:hypothetical protein [Roseiflexus castenholzii]